MVRTLPLRAICYVTGLMLSPFREYSALSNMMRSLKMPASSASGLIADGLTVGSLSTAAFRSRLLSPSARNPSESRIGKSLSEGASYSHRSRRILVGFKREVLTLESSSITFVSKSRSKKGLQSSRKKTAVTFLLTLLAVFNSNPITFQTLQNSGFSATTLVNPDADIDPEDLKGFPVTYSQIDVGGLMSKMWDSVGKSVTERERERENGRQTWREDRRGNGKVRGRENGGESGIENGNEREREREAGKGREDGMESESASFSTALDLYLERGGKQSNMQTSTTNTQVHLNHNTEDRTVGVGSRGQLVSGIPYKDRIEGGIGRGGTVHPVIQNRIVHYGVYCGPGPADAFSGVPPVDPLDRVCQGHDQRYRMCLEDLEKESLTEGIFHRLNIPIPRQMHQLMAVRGLLPPFLGNSLSSVLPKYARCIHRADTFFVQGLNRVVVDGLVPVWWSSPSLAPLGAEGVEGFAEACALGIKHPLGGKNAGLCLLPSRSLFLGAALDMFESDLALDNTQEKKRGNSDSGAGDGGEGDGGVRMGSIGRGGSVGRKGREGESWEEEERR